MVKESGELLKQLDEDYESDGIFDWQAMVWSVET